MKPFYIVQLNKKNNINEGYLAILDPMKYELDELRLYAETMKTELGLDNKEIITTIGTWFNEWLNLYYTENEYVNNSVKISYKNTNYEIYIDEVEGRYILKN